MSEDKRAYIPVPVAAAAEIADKYAKDIIVIMSVDHEHDLLHTTTYGRTPEDKALAAIVGRTAAAALSDTSKATDYQDYRLEWAKKLQVALRNIIVEINNAALWRTSPGSALSKAEETLTESIKFLGEQRQ